MVSHDDGSKLQINFISLNLIDRLVFPSELFPILFQGLDCHFSEVMIDFPIDDPFEPVLIVVSLCLHLKMVQMGWAVMPFMIRHLRVNDFDFVMLILSHTDKEIKIILLEYISIYNATILSTFCHLTLLNYFEFSLCFFFLFTLYSQTLREYDQAEQGRQ